MYRYGYVLDVYLPTDKNNRREHRGFGFVTFETEAAVQRISVHGTHTIRVRPCLGVQVSSVYTWQMCLGSKVRNPCPCKLYSVGSLGGPGWLWVCHV